MTYCVGMMLDEGFVLMSDTRTNSGVDNISVFRKMFHWSVPGERMIALMTAGNLATTQTVVSKLEERDKTPGERHNSLLQLPTMFQIAVEVGKLLRETVQGTQDENGMQGKGRFTASMILAGQIPDLPRR
jgi:putative proteasome-type protease